MANHQPNVKDISTHLKGSAPHPEWINSWLTADAVCFDVDSTVIKDEAIDELAKFCGVGEQVSKSTQQAMGGKMSFQEALKTRLDIIKPSKHTLHNYLDSNPPKLTDGIKELVHILQEKKIDVYLISGGFLIIIETIAKHLNIPKDHIHANILYFDAEGKYGGFDTNQPTSRNGGKAEVIQHLKSKHHYKNVVMIGDGATDMEACPPALEMANHQPNVKDISTHLKGSAPHPEWINTWLTADAVCFDVDSTVIKDEAIDELAKFCGVGEQVSKSTQQAMGGKMSFQEALKTRLDIIKPSKHTLHNYLDSNPPKLTDGIKELVHILQEKKIDVYLISGGFLVIIETIAKHLNIPKDHIHANILYFDAEGNYGSFDTNQPTSRNGGKAEVIQHLKSKHHYKNVVMIGDGATDMEACPPADLFIGFGGNVVREIVKTQSKWFIMSFKELIDLFQKDSK
ncbi:hypothetical protein Ahia01_000902600 [Argonauta hians]